MNAALLQCFVKIGLFQHANAPAAVAAAGAGYRCSLFKYDAERFADGGAARAQAVLVSALGVHPAARALRALRLGHGDGQARVIHALSNNGALCGGSFVRADVGDDEDLRKVNSLDRIQRSLCVLP